MNIPAIAVHGGSGTLLASLEDPDIAKKYHRALQQALDEGYELLKDGRSPMEAVTEAVCSLEDCELFNAGRGSVFTAKGKHEMDAAVMEGRELRAGAVTGIYGIKNPVLLARSVMDNTEFVFLAGEEAMEFAHKQEFELHPESYFFVQHRYDQLQEIKGSDEVKLDHSSKDDRKFGTVGAVAVDSNGHVAAATSTGGMTNKSWGRIGDSPIIGAGTYANDATCAASCTGYGEYFIRAVAAYDVSCRMEYKQIVLEQAAAEVIQERIDNMGGEGGLIAVDNRGNIAMPFNSDGMYRGMKSTRGSSTAIR